MGAKYVFNPLTGNLDTTDVVVFNGEVNLGTAAAPSVFFTGDTNTGIYSPGADQLAISTGGTGRMFVDSSGCDVVGRVRASTGILFGNDTDPANALDDYEEGAWTPLLTVDGSTSNISYNSWTGEYTKIGNLVYVSGELDVASYTLANTGQLEIARLPFTSSAPTGKNFQFFQVTISGINLSQDGYPNLSPLNVVWGRLITSDIANPTASSIGLYISADSGATNINPRPFAGAYLFNHTPFIQFSGSYTI